MGERTKVLSWAMLGFLAALMTTGCGACQGMAERLGISPAESTAVLPPVAEDDELFLALSGRQQSRQVEAVQALRSEYRELLELHGSRDAPEVVAYRDRVLGPLVAAYSERRQSVFIEVLAELDDPRGSEAPVTAVVHGSPGAEAGLVLLRSWQTAPGAARVMIDQAIEQFDGREVLCDPLRPDAVDFIGGVPGAHAREALGRILLGEEFGLSCSREAAAHLGRRREMESIPDLVAGRYYFFEGGYALNHQTVREAATGALHGYGALAFDGVLESYLGQNEAALDFAHAEEPARTSMTAEEILRSRAVDMMNNIGDPRGGAFVLERLSEIDMYGAESAVALLGKYRFAEPERVDEALFALHRRFPREVRGVSLASWVHGPELLPVLQQQVMTSQWATRVGQAASAYVMIATAEELDAIPAEVQEAFERYKSRNVFLAIRHVTELCGGDAQCYLQVLREGGASLHAALRRKCATMIQRFAWGDADIVVALVDVAVLEPTVYERPVLAAIRQMDSGNERTIAALERRIREFDERQAQQRRAANPEDVDEVEQREDEMTYAQWTLRQLTVRRDGMRAMEAR